MSQWRPGQVKTFGRAVIGDARPSPLGGMHAMDNAGDAKKAEKTGIYIVKGDTGTETHMRFKEGDILPAGATWRDAGSDPEQSQRQIERERIAEKAETQEEVAPVTRAKGPAPENRAK